MGGVDPRRLHDLRRGTGWLVLGLTVPILGPLVAAPYLAAKLWFQGAELRPVSAAPMRWLRGAAAAALLGAVAGVLDLVVDHDGPPQSSGASVVLLVVLVAYTAGWARAGAALGLPAVAARWRRARAGWLSLVGAFVALGGAALLLPPIELPPGVGGVLGVPAVILSAATLGWAIEETARAATTTDAALLAAAGRPHPMAPARTTIPAIRPPAG